MYQLGLLRAQELLKSKFSASVDCWLIHCSPKKKKWNKKKAGRVSCSENVFVFVRLFSFHLNLFFLFVIIYLWSDLLRYNYFAGVWWLKMFIKKSEHVRMLFCCSRSRCHPTSQVCRPFLCFSLKSWVFTLLDELGFTILFPVIILQLVPMDPQTVLKLRVTSS